MSSGASAPHSISASMGTADSAATFAETVVVIDAGQPGSFDRFIHARDIQVVSIDIEQASIAREAYRQFRKGSREGRLGISVTA